MARGRIAKGLSFIALLSLVPEWPGACDAARANEIGSRVSTSLQPDPAVRHGRLPNGIEYLILENHEPRARASLRFAVKAGSLNETEEQRGLAHYLEHLAFDGSTHFPPGTLVEYLQRLGLSFGGDTNAFTSFNRTEYMLELPDTKPQTLEKALTLFADYGDGLLLTPEQVNKERGIILGEERTRNSVEYREEVDEFRFLLPHSLVAERQPIGVIDVLQHATREPIKAFYDTWYRPENFVVSVVGDVDPIAVEAQLKEILTPVHAHGAAAPAPIRGRVDSGIGLATRLHHDPNAPAITVALESVSPYSHRTEPDTAQRRLQRLPRDLAFAMLTRRLAVLAHKDGAVFTEGSAHVDEQFDFVRNPTIQVSGPPDRWEALVATTEHELRRAMQYGFTPHELKEAAANARNALEQAVRTVATRNSRALADALVNAVIDYQVFTTPAADLALLGPALERVSPEDCRRALRAVWPDTLGRYIYVSGNLKLADSGKLLAAAYRHSARTAVAAPMAESAETFAYIEFGSPGEVTSKRTIDDLGITEVEFRNGVRLNVKPTDFEAGQVLVSVRVGSGRLTEPKGAPGLSVFAQNAFEAGGLGKLSHDDLVGVLAGKTVGFAFQVEDDALAFAGATSSADLPLEMQVMAAYVTDPGYRPEAQRQFAKSTSQFYSGLAHDAWGPLQLEVPQLLSSGDSRFGLPPKEKIKERTLDELKSWLAPQLSSGPLEIAVVGDLDLGATIAAVARTFGALPQRALKPAYTEERRVAIPTAGVMRQFSVDTDVPRGIVDVRWPATDQRDDIRRAHRLQLLTAILSDRLRVVIREQMGDTYSPHVRADLSQTFTDYGFIDAQSIVAPDRAAAVGEVIKGLGEELAKSGVTADQLERARAPLLTQLRQSARSNGYWLNTVLAGAQEYPQHLDWARERTADFESITAEELSSLAAQYLVSSRAFEFISVPGKRTSGG